MQSQLGTLCASGGLVGTALDCDASDPGSIPESAF